MEKKGSYLPIITKKESTRVAVGDVIMIEKDERKLVVEADRKRYRYYEKIENVTEYLDDRFFKILDGCVINLDKISSMRDGVIHFTNGRELKVNTNDYSRARRKFNDFITGKK